MARTLYELEQEDVFDSRDIIDRMDEIQEALNEDYPSDPDLADERDEAIQELDALKAIQDTGIEDFEHGVTFVRDSYFQEYAQELAEEIGAIPENGAWPTYCIDWEWAARELRMDYYAVTVGSTDFWVR